MVLMRRCGKPDVVTRSHFDALELSESHLQISEEIKGAYRELIEARREVSNGELATMTNARKITSRETTKAERIATDDTFDRMIEAEFNLIETPSRTLRDLAVKVAVVAQDEFASEATTELLSRECCQLSRLDLI